MPNNPSDFALTLSGAPGVRSRTLDASQVGAASAVELAHFIADRAYTLASLSLSASDAGSASATTATVNINGVAVTGLLCTLDNAAANYAVASDTPTAVTEIAAGDVLTLDIVSIATNATDLVLSAVLHEVV